MPLKLSLEEITNLKNTNNISIDEIMEIYLPLSKLLNHHIHTKIIKKNILKNFLNTHKKNAPYIIGIAGSVAVGKSTTAKILQILLSKCSEHRIVELVTTDGFLYPNHTLKKKHLIKKKGFPQSYDINNLIKFIIKIKSGKKTITAPTYSHLTYDIIKNTQQVIYNPDILILEGLNILQTNNYYNILPNTLISDFIDFSIYIDAPEHLLKEWYIDRFLKFCNITFSYPNTYFHRYSQLSKTQIISTASQLWNEINGLNLKKNILPTKKYANLILKKGINHTVNNIQTTNTINT